MTPLQRDDRGAGTTGVFYFFILGRGGAGRQSGCDDEFPGFHLSWVPGHAVGQFRVIGS